MRDGSGRRTPENHSKREQNEIGLRYAIPSPAINVVQNRGRNGFKLIVPSKCEKGRRQKMSPYNVSRLGTDRQIFSGDAIKARTWWAPHIPLNQSRLILIASGQSKVKNPDSRMLQIRTKDPPFDNGQRILVGRLHCGYLAITKWLVSCRDGRMIFGLRNQEIRNTCDRQMGGIDRLRYKASEKSSTYRRWMTPHECQKLHRHRERPSNNSRHMVVIDVNKDKDSRHIVLT